MGPCLNRCFQTHSVLRGSMGTLFQLLSLVFAALIVWTMYRTIKGRPELFSREKISKSFSSMGILALLLIGFVGLMVLMLRTY